MTEWSTIVRQIMAEKGVSERELSARSGVYRSTMRRFLRGMTSLRVDQLDAVLAELGHSLAIVARKGGAQYLSQLPVKDPSPVTAPKRKTVKPFRWRNGKLNEAKPSCH